MVAGMTRRLSISRGDRFGHLVAVQVHAKHGNGNQWLFRCDCGADYINRPSQITIGRARSCGCARKKPIPIEKFCSNCREKKLAAEFENNRNECRSCRNKNRKDYEVRRTEVDPKYAERRKRYGEDKPNRAKKIFYSARSSATMRNLPFLISESDVVSALERQRWKCARTGISFDLAMTGGKRPFGPTIDRIDNARGYEPDNIQFVCLMYNTGKGQFTDDDFLILAHAVVEHHQTSTLTKLKLRRVV